MEELIDQAAEQTQALRTFTDEQTRSLQDFTRRLELILSQEHKKITVRDEAFPAEFASFCQILRQELDKKLEFWQEMRKNLRGETKIDGAYGLALSIKSFSMRSKTLSRSADEFTSAYDTFNRFYKNYTRAKLPVWLLTSCCDDLNNLTGKILFISRELAKKTERQRRSTGYAG